MANIKVSQMTEATSVDNEDLFMIVQNSTNKKVSKQTLMQPLNTVVTELQEEIEKLKEASYKVSGTGTNVTLNNTSNNKFLKLDVKGNTEQTQYSGKNLLPIINQDYTVKGVNFKATNQGKMLINGTANNIIGGSDFIGNNFAKMTLSAGTYVFSRNIANSKVSLGLVKSDGTTSIATLSRTTTILSTTFTLNEETDVYLYFYISTNDVVNNYEVEIMVEQGSTATAFEPFCGGTASPNPEFPQPIYNVTGDVNVKIQNKNLLPFTNQDFTISGMNFKVINGTLYLNGTNTQEISSANTNFKEGFSFTLPAGTYYLQKSSGYGGYIRKYDDNTVLRNNPGSFTLTEKTKVYYGIYMAVNVTKTNEKTIEQLEENSTATSYVAHQEQNLPFTLGTQRLYEGSNLADDGIHNKEATTVLGDASSLITGTILGVVCKFAYYMLPNAKNVTRSYDFKCNKVYPANDVWGQYGGYRNSTALYVMTNSDDTLENFNSKISGAIVEYELNEETITPYNETQQAQYNAIKEAMSYYGQTHISSTSDEIEAKIDATAIGDLNLVIS